MNLNSDIFDDYNEEEALEEYEIEELEALDELDGLEEEELLEGEESGIVYMDEEFDE